MFLFPLQKQQQQQQRQQQHHPANSQSAPPAGSNPPPSPLLQPISREVLLTEPGLSNPRIVRRKRADAAASPATAMNDAWTSAGGDGGGGPRGRIASRQGSLSHAARPGRRLMNFLPRSFFNKPLCIPHIIYCY